MSLFDDLRAQTGQQWTQYVRHPFVEQLADGSLPIAAFQDYLKQDYLFLIQFARANALAGYKSRNLTDLRAASDSFAAILDETRLHIRLAQRWGVQPEDLDRVPEKQGTVAYTRFVLDCGAAGDLLDLHVALAPCVIGYAEIGARLAPQAQRQDHPYREWIEEYASDDYQALAAVAADRLDALAEGAAGEARGAELAATFRTATRLEADFWQQALDAVD